MSGDGRRREGPNPSRYLGSRSVDTSLSQPTEEAITQQPTQTKLRPRPEHHLETRSAGHGDGLDNEWEIVDEVDSREDSAMTKDLKSHRTDSTVSTDSNTALEEALAENQQLRDKHSNLLRRLSDQEKKSRRLQEQLVKKDEEVTQLYTELTASRGPSSGLSTGSFQTPPSSLSQLEQQDPSHLEGQNALLLHLQTDNQSKGEEISKLRKEVTQLKRRLDYAEDLEKQNTQLATAVSVHEEESKKLQKQMQQLQRGVRSQASHRDEAGILLECDTLKKEITNLRSQLEATRRYETEYLEEVRENALLQEKLTAAEKELRGSVTRVDDTDVEETKTLKEALQGRELQIEQLQRQLESYRKTATEFGELQQHSKKQSQQVMQLRSHVDASQVEEAERTEYERTLKESLHSLQEQNEKLMSDYQSVSKDRGFYEESLRTLKKQHEELISKCQQCEAQLGELSQQEESARKQLESISDNYRAVCLKNEKLLKENQQLEADNSQFVTTVKKLTDMANENADLQRKIIAMRQEKEELLNELQVAKTESQLYKEDFETEREDRAKAHSQMDDIRTHFTTKLEETRRELEQHQDRLTEVEAVNKRKEGEMRSALEEALAARQEVQAKTSQVKQYKKQVDSLKAQVSETEKQHTNLIQEMEKVRNELVKFKGKAEKAHKKKQSTERVPTPASSPVALPPPGWESRVAELENINGELRRENDKLKHDNEEFRDEVQNLQKMVADLKSLLDRQHIDRAYVPPHGFPPGAESGVMDPSVLSPTGTTDGDQSALQRGTLALQQPHPPPIAGYGQDQRQIRQQLQQGFQQQPYTEEHTAGAGRLTSLPSGPTSLPEGIHQQPFPPRARIPPPDSLPHASRSSEVAPYSDRNPAISPTSHPHHNWPPSSGAGNFPVQGPGAKAFTDPHMITKHHLAEGQLHSSYPADSNPALPMAHQGHIQPQPHNYQRQRSGSGSSPQGQQQQQTYVAKEDPLMQDIDTDIHAVVSQVSAERTHQATMQHVPYDPNLVCAYCNKQFRMGEIQKYKHHVGNCGGSDGTEV